MNVINNAIDNSRQLTDPILLDRCLTVDICTMTVLEPDFHSRCQTVSQYHLYSVGTW